MHLTDKSPSVVSATEPGLGLVQWRLEGFITVDVLREALDQSLEHFGDHFGEMAPRRMLFDLREVTGYGSGTPTIARRFLDVAADLGAERIAFVSHSSVLRTITRVLTAQSGGRLELRCFSSEQVAHGWLSGEPLEHLLD